MIVLEDVRGLGPMKRCPPGQWGTENWADLFLVLSRFYRRPNAAGEQRPTLDETGAKPTNVSGGPSAPVAA